MMRKVRRHAVFLARCEVTSLRFATSVADGFTLAVPSAKIPILTIAGTNDPTCDLVALESTKPMLPQQQVILYEKAGHWLMVESKEDLLRDVNVWLSAVLKA